MSIRCAVGVTVNGFGKDGLPVEKVQAVRIDIRRSMGLHLFIIDGYSFQ